MMWHRLVDDQSFSLAEVGVESRCRLQILISSGSRFFAVAVQRPDGSEGASTTNHAERVAALARQRYLPPTVRSLAVLLHHPQSADAGSRLGLVFDEDSRLFRGPSWEERAAVRQAAILEPAPMLVAVADPLPGDVFVWREVVGLPPAHLLFRAPLCMGPPAGGPFGLCCWYHSIDWRAASQLTRSRLLGDQSGDWSSSALDGADSRKFDPIVIGVDFDGSESIINGQHRLEAMRHHGVPATAVVMSEPAVPPGAIVLGRFPAP